MHNPSMINPRASSLLSNYNTKVKEGVQQMAVSALLQPHRRKPDQPGRQRLPQRHRTVDPHLPDPACTQRTHRQLSLCQLVSLSV